MNQELKQYVETTIIPKYEMFDKAITGHMYALSLPKA